MFLTPSDLAPFVDIDVDKADAMIEDAEAQAMLVAPCIADLTEVDDAVKFAAVKSILRQAVIRWEESGAGGVTTHQQGAGPYQEMTVHSTHTRKGAFWPSEIEQLQSICKSVSGAFAIDTAPSLSGAHAPWCSLVFGATYCSCGTNIAGEPIYETG